MSAITMVPLRTAHPPRGLITLRHSIPAVHSIATVQQTNHEHHVAHAGEAQQVLKEQHNSTTPQVVNIDDAIDVRETAVRKGRKAQ